MSCLLRFLPPHDVVPGRRSSSIRPMICGGVLALLAAAGSATAHAQNNGDNGIVGDTAGNAALAQSNTPANPASGNSGVQVMLQPTLDQIQRMIGSLDTGHWKAPNEVRADVDRNVASIQRDLETTLPGLIATASAAPGSTSPAFAVYRNIDALYDVLLRVEQTAELAAPDKEAAAISSTLNKLESSRHQLGDAIATWSQNQEGDLAKLRAQARAAAVAASQTQAVPARAAVVDDGPTPAPKPKKKKKPAAATPAQAAPAQGAPTPQ